MMRLFFTILLLFVISSFAIYAQNTSVTGTITDAQTGDPVAGVNIRIDAVSKIFTSDEYGRYKIDIFPGEYVIRLKLMGYETLVRTVNITNADTEFDFVLTPDPVLMGQGVTVTSTKAPVMRSNIETSVPVDIIDAQEIQESGKRELSQVLMTLVPSFTSGRQTFSDATDHIDPATLRSLGPDQVLVLVNGKRRHTTSLVNVTPIIGRGSVGTDLNAIPVSSIDRIEILRDGASAQYGSDAIAGVINIITKDDPQSAAITATAGQTIENDGQQLTVGTNFGFDLFEEGFVNVTLEGRRRESTNRAEPYTGLIYRTQGQDGLSDEENFARDNQIIADRGLTRSDFNLRVGNSAQTNGAVFINAEVPVSDVSKFYAFGGINYRESRAAGYYRYPNNPNNNVNIYPDGFLPFMHPRVYDNSYTFGFRTQRSAWNIDLSNSFGSNRIDYFVGNSLNRAYGDNSPTSFYCGTTDFSQNTVNLDLSRDFGEILNLNSFVVSFGGEFRYENYQIIQGEESSWGYSPEFEDSTYAYGAQVFPGFRPENAVDKSRQSGAAYLELTSDITDKLLISAAGRFESYSDFGNSLTGKIAGRYRFFDLFMLRASVSTGFRAPSLHQQYYSSVSTIFYPLGEDGAYIPFDVATVRNDSRIAQAFGIGNLQEETSMNYSAGLTSKITENTTLTVDAYQIDIDDRIVLSGHFVPAFNDEIAEILKDIDIADAAQFFSNAINTRTRGIDVILTHSMYFGDHSFGLTGAVNINETEIVGDIKLPENIEGEGQKVTLFNREEQGRLTKGQPQNKIVLSLNYKFNNFGLDLRTVRYGEVTHLLDAINEDQEFYLDQTYSAKWVTDLEISYNIFGNTRIFAGANNLLNVYPDKNITEKQDGGRFPYNTAVTQFGFMGTYYYAGLNVNL